ncbi:MAG TPA: fasciclin domain-containing protein, partial [Burkholderiales bacterium]|nr:fasciclin domain-containing protein [Burkholderiales bacterium]
MKLASNFRLLLLGLVFAFAGGVASADTRSSGADIVDTAVSAGSFTTLVAAIEAAGLVDTLKG